MRILLSTDTARRLSEAAIEHKVSMAQQATICVVAALAAAHAGSRTAIPREDPATEPGALPLDFVPKVETRELLQRAAAARNMSIERLAALIVDRAVNPPPAPRRPPPFRPRRWRPIAALVRPAAALTPAQITAAVLGDPSHGASITARSVERRHIPASLAH